MNHKRGVPKRRRAGCLLCKANKLGQGMENELRHSGFGKIRDEQHARDDLREVAILTVGIRRSYCNGVGEGYERE